MIFLLIFWSRYLDAWERYRSESKFSHRTESIVSIVIVVGYFGWCHFFSLRKYHWLECIGIVSISLEYFQWIWNPWCRSKMAWHRFYGDNPKFPLLMMNIILLGFRFIQIPWLWRVSWSMRYFSRRGPVPQVSSYHSPLYLFLYAPLFLKYISLFWPLYGPHILLCGVVPPGWCRYLFLCGADIFVLPIFGL